MNMIYVIAGNQQQFVDYVQRNIEWRHHCGEFSASTTDYVYVADTRSLMGIKEPHGVFIGTFKEREDISEILTQLLTTYESGQIPKSVMNLYNEVRKKP